MERLVGKISSRIRGKNLDNRYYERLVGFDVIGVERGENEEKYFSNRSMFEYEGCLQGLDEYFEYLFGLSENPVLLDVGAGTGRAASEIRDRFQQRGLRVRATTLRKIQGFDYLGDDILEANFENLAGIADVSAHGILGVFSFGYAYHLGRAAEGIDQVLVPGGVLKAVLSRRPNRRYNYVKTGKSFSKELSRLGYDLDMIDVGQRSIITAIKPGGNQNISAIELARKDQGKFLSRVSQISPSL